MPSAPGVAKGFVTVGAVLPVESEHRSDTMCVLDMHVVFARGGRGNPLLASTHIPDEEYHAKTVSGIDMSSLNPDLRILGVSLDYLPYESTMHEPFSGPAKLDSRQMKHLQRQQEGARSFSFAVNGVVPIAVPSSVLDGAILGDKLCIVPRGLQGAQYFSSPHHKGATFRTETRAPADPNIRLLGTIVALPARHENHCLILLDIH